MPGLALRTASSPSLSGSADPSSDSKPSKVNPDRRPAVFSVETGLERAEGDFARPWLVIVIIAGPEVEMIAIPKAGFDDPPAADKPAVRRRACRRHHEPWQPGGSCQTEHRKTLF